MKIAKERLFFHVPYRILLDNLEFIGSKGINPEIYVDAKTLDGDISGELKYIKAIFSKFNLKNTVHAPFMDLNPGSPDSKIRQISVARLLQGIDFAKATGSSAMVAHSGYDPIYHEHRKKEWLKFSVDSWRDVVKKAQEFGVTLAIENSIETDCENILALLKEICSDNFKACFDIGHYNVFGKIPVLDMLENYPQDSIAEVHLSDNKGDLDQHLALGTGGIDFTAFFDALDRKNIKPIFTVEPHSIEDLEACFAYLEKNSLVK